MDLFSQINFICFLFMAYFLTLALWGLIMAGRKAYSLTWALQYVNLFMINTGYIILAGSALKVRSNRINGLLF